MEVAIFQFLNGFAGRSDILDSAAVFFATYLPYLMVIAAIFFILKRGDNRQKVFTFVSTALTLILSRGLITEIIRFVYNRPRPFEVLGGPPLFIPDTHSSFPSGHAAFFFALALTLFYFDKKWGWWFLGLALLNGLARIFAGVHWPSDILGGLAVALVSYLITTQLLKRYQPAVPDELYQPKN